MRKRNTNILKLHNSTPSCYEEEEEEESEATHSQSPAHSQEEEEEEGIGKGAPVPLTDQKAEGKSTPIRKRTEPVD